MLGKPDFKEGDMVRFKLETGEGTVTRKGVIDVVDPNGTREQQEEASYDIFALEEGQQVLFKHVRESAVEKVDADEWLNGGDKN